MSKEIKKESEISGKEKDVISEDGVKVGETKREPKGFFGRTKFVTRNFQGVVVSESRWEGSKLVTSDPQGIVKLSETRREGGKEVIYQEGRKIGELRREQGFWDTIFGTEKKVLHEVSGVDIDLTTRTVREETRSVYGWCPDCGSSEYDGYECLDCGGYYDEEEDDVRASQLTEREREIERALVGKSGFELNYIAQYDRNLDLRKATVRRIPDGFDLRHIAQYDRNPDMRRIAVSRISDTFILNYIAQYDRDSEVRQIAVSRVTDVRNLEFISKFDRNPDVRNEAKRRLEILRQQQISNEPVAASTPTTEKKHPSQSSKKKPPRGRFIQRAGDTGESGIQRHGYPDTGIAGARVRKLPRGRSSIDHYP